VRDTNTPTDAPGVPLKRFTRVRKINSAAGDSHPDGATATIVGSVGTVETGFSYFIKWDDYNALGVPTAIRDKMVEGIETPRGELPAKYQEVCDFCPAKNVSRVFRAYDCAVPWVPVEGNQIVVSGGGWAACHECAEMIDAERWAELASRSVRGFCEKNHVFDLAGIAASREQIERTQKLFRDHRILGPSGVSNVSSVGISEV
jgi:hypothetical protein